MPCHTWQQVWAVKLPEGDPVLLGQLLQTQVELLKQRPHAFILLQVHLELLHKHKVWLWHLKVLAVRATVESKKREIISIFSDLGSLLRSS